MCDVHGWCWADDDEMGCPLCFGINAERERIIGLLDGEMCQKDSELVECWCGSWLEAIALIKGENK